MARDAEVWVDALRLPEESDLTKSLCLKLGRLTGNQYLEDVKRRCQQAVHAMKEEWVTKVRAEAEKP